MAHEVLTAASVAKHHASLSRLSKGLLLTQTAFATTAVTGSVSDMSHYVRDYHDKDQYTRSTLHVEIQSPSVRQRRHL